LGNPIVGDELSPIPTKYTQWRVKAKSQEVLDRFSIETGTYTLLPLLADKREENSRLSFMNERLVTGDNVDGRK